MNDTSLTHSAPQIGAAVRQADQPAEQPLRRPSTHARAVKP